MSTALPAAALTDEPLARVLAFSRRFGRETTALAMHAALPLGLSPELVHLLRVNFVPRAPWIAEADLLLSPLCMEAGGGMYEMDPDVRELLLAEMARTPALGPARQRQVAQFLRLWAARALNDAADPDQQEHLRVQQWVALAYAEPARAAEELAGALRAGVERGSRPQVARVARLTALLSAPLAAEVELRRYAGTVQRVAAGAAAPVSSGAGAITVGGEALPALDDVVRLWRPGPTGEGGRPSDTGQAPDEQRTEGDAAPRAPVHGYRVARILVVGIPGTVAADVLRALGAGRREHMQPPAPDVTTWRWKSDSITGTNAWDFVFHVFESQGPPPLILVADSAAILTVMGDDQTPASLESWAEPRSIPGPLRPTLFAIETTDLSREAELRDRFRGELTDEQMLVVSSRTGGGFGALAGLIHRVAEAEQVPSAASRAEVDALEERFRPRLAGSSSDLLDPSEREDPALVARLRCLEARDVLKLVGDPPYAFVRPYEFAVGAAEVWRLAREASSDVPGLPSVPINRLREHFESQGLTQYRRDAAPGVLEAVVDDLVRRRWAYEVDARRGRLVVIPGLYPAHASLSGTARPEGRPLVQARWPGRVDDVFVLLLVHLADAATIDLRPPHSALLASGQQLYQLHASEEGGTAQVTLSALREGEDAAGLSHMIHDRVGGYLPEGVRAEVSYGDAASPSDSPDGSRMTPDEPPAANSALQFTNVVYSAGISSEHDFGDSDLGSLSIQGREAVFHGEKAVLRVADVRGVALVNAGGGIYPPWVRVRYGDRNDPLVGYFAQENKLPTGDMLGASSALLAAFHSMLPEGTGLETAETVPSMDRPADVDLARACLAVLPFRTRQVGERVIDFEEVWEHLIRPAVEGVRLSDGASLVPVLVPDLPAAGSPLPDWMKSALMVLVDLTGADAARIRELGLVPGARTQHVVLLQETYDPSVGIADDQVIGYAYGDPEVLAGQRELLAQRLAEVLGVPGGGTGEGGEPLVVTAVTLNVRQGPGSDHSVLTQLVKGARVEPLERSGDWLRVRTPNGVVGWINAHFAAPGNAPAPDDEAPVRGRVRVTAVTMNVRAGPDTDQRPVGQVSQGTILDRLEDSPDGRWLRVRSPDGLRGWVSSTYVRPVDEDAAPGAERVFLAAYAPMTLDAGEMGRVHFLAYSENLRAREEAFLASLPGGYQELHVPDMPQPEPAGTISVRLTLSWAPAPTLGSGLSWNGEWAAGDLQFLVPADVPEGPGEIQVEFTTRERTEVPSSQWQPLRFIVRIAPPGTSSVPPFIARTAFACFARDDRAQVLVRVESLRRATGLDVSVGMAPIPAGEEWEARLDQEICSRNVFLLYWSGAAARSRVVERDWRRALECSRASGTPEIQIHLLEKEAARLLPEELRQFHAMPVAEKPVVFISSSTMRGLTEYRAAAVHACETADMTPMSIDSLVSQPIDSIGQSRDWVDRADVYVAILGHRYGFVPAGSEISVAEIEFNRAMERRIPTLIFMLDEEIPAPPGDVETDTEAAEKLKKFKERVGNAAIVRVVDSPEDLRLRAARALTMLRPEIDKRASDKPQDPPNAQRARGPRRKGEDRA